MMNSERLAIKTFFLLLAFMMISASCSSTSKFEKAGHATLALQKAISAGVTYDQFRILLQDLAAEIQKLKNTAKSQKEQKMLSIYGKILETYEHGHETWKLQIDFNKGDAEYLTTTSAGIRRSYLIQGYWNQAEEEFKQLNEM